jgi:membrane-associated phospholipid phosphatase
VILSAAAIAAMVTTAATRLALGAHFLSDVVGSLILMTALVPALHILFGLGRLSARRRAALG